MSNNVREALRIGKEAALRIEEKRAQAIEAARRGPDEHARRNRMAEFNGPINDIALDNPIVARMIDCYAHGQIVTREEALSQMVVALANTTSDLQKQCMKLLLTSPQPMSVTL